MSGQIQATFPQQTQGFEGFKPYGKFRFKQYGKFLLKYTTQAEGLDVARRLTSAGSPYHMTSTQETIGLVETKPDEVVRQKAIEGTVLTSEVSKYGGPVAVDLVDGGMRLRVSDFRFPDSLGWVVLAPDASEAAAPQVTNILRASGNEGMTIRLRGGRSVFLENAEEAELGQHTK